MFPQSTITPSKTKQTSMNISTPSQTLPPPILRQAAPKLWSAPKKPPTWPQQLAKAWKVIEAKHKAGDRTKAVVCAWVAYKAARSVAKGHGDRRLYVQFVGVGYAAACKRWDELHSGDAYFRLSMADPLARLAPMNEYNPIRDNGGGIEPPLYAAAKGRMSNAAFEASNVFNARKRSADDVIPFTSEWDEQSRSQSGWAAPNTGQLDPEVRAGGVVTLGSSSTERRAEHDASEALDIYISDLLAFLPNEARRFIAEYWGIEGLQHATLKELAARAGRSESTIRRRLIKLCEEILATHVATCNNGCWWCRTPLETKQ
jgi:hypothetical protein